MINSLLHTESIPQQKVELESIQMDNETFFRMSNSHLLRPFFMSMVSDANHWLFVASNGGLTAGRKNAQFALFPYYTDDKITENVENTGCKTIFQVFSEADKYIWEPFSIRNEGRYKTSQNVYKNAFGNSIVFEEINHDLQLRFRYRWRSSKKYGFLRSAELINESVKPVEIKMLDGIQNIVPAGIGSDLQNQYSNLVDAYKRSELDSETGLGIFALSAIIVDKAEASEALKANIVWGAGAENSTHLLSSLQLSAFRAFQEVQPESDIKAERGAYFVRSDFRLGEQDKKTWHLVADVDKDHSAIAELQQQILTHPNLIAEVVADAKQGTENLIRLNAAADGLQRSADKLRDARHFSNTLFNCMRGGIFDANYTLEKSDFLRYIEKANFSLFKEEKDKLHTLTESFSLLELHTISEGINKPDFTRLANEYLPLKFSRRHGDPSRPWNKFSINTQSEDGSKILDYEGNWRDIFQNWEALAHAYPGFIQGMITKFLNASTFDGYNPYRVTKDGFDWEVIEPDDPWSYIGYWGDHQIIYLLKFLEFAKQYQPDFFSHDLQAENFVYANVPYVIKSYDEICENPKDTILFDEELDNIIRKRREQLGADGALLRNAKDRPVRATFLEKILATTLAKIANFVPETGIWMNTQRPEWNDANNALVGNGVSMVTLYYLRRFLHFMHETLADVQDEKVSVSTELHTFFLRVAATLDQNKDVLKGAISSQDKKGILDELGLAASAFRTQIYTNGFSGEKNNVAVSEIRTLFINALDYLDHSIRANKRKDSLYNAYNLMSITQKGIEVDHLSEMLEGQVAVLSAGVLSHKEALEVLDALKNSKLFRPDQYSYLLYPNKTLKGFLERNRIDEGLVNSSQLLRQLVADENHQIIQKDAKGVYHFNGNFRNADDLKAALNGLRKSSYKPLVKAETEKVLAIFESVFNHKSFTGRSGTFYGYEGLGSIYWHMVSKLLLAVQECCQAAIRDGENEAIVGGLLDHYYEINAGIGVHKCPSLYGAFPTDPYSHTPGGKGAQQPGMTGQVKEDVLCRFGELGRNIVEGKIVFDPQLLRKEEFLREEASFDYVSVDQKTQRIDLKPHQLAFTFCQVPVIYTISDQNKIGIQSANGEYSLMDGHVLDRERSQSIFLRKGEISCLKVEIDKEVLK